MRSSLFVAAFLLSLWPAPARADCTGPDQPEGFFFYNTDFGVPVYCNGTDWIPAADINPSAGGPGCASPPGAEGLVIYNKDHHVLQYCDGDDWKALGSSPPIVLDPEPAISAGAGQSCGVRADGVAMCWGAGTFGILGNGATAHQPEPVTVNGGYSWTTITASLVSHTCGLRTDGVAMCWGRSLFGSLGNSTAVPSDQPAPVLVDGSFTWKAISAGGNHTCGLRTDGVAMCWGQANSGQLGNGATTPDQLAPVTVNGGHHWKAISAGLIHTCGLRASGVAMCWGTDVLGQLGNGTTSPDQSQPVTVDGGHTWKAISAGSAHTCGIRTDGVAMCWGHASSGKLGNGATSPNQLAPVTVNGGHTWKTISAGAVHTCGIRTDGVAMCWGQPASGQLGNGTTTPDQLSPVTVNGGYTWKTISAGSAHTCGTRTDGVAMCWGQASSGKLGNGTTTPDQLAPVTVNAGPAPPSFAPGGQQSY